MSGFSLNICLPDTLSSFHLHTWRDTEEGFLHLMRKLRAVGVL